MSRRALPSPADDLITIQDFVRYALTQFIEAQLVFGHGTSDPLAEAIFLVCEALHLRSEHFELLPNARLTRAERDRVLRLVEARVRTRKPAAYLLHRAYIRGVPFYVDERVIVPRSYLGELLGTDLVGGEQGLIDDPAAVGRVLDLCTGSGCLAILACDTFPNARIDATDISEEALQVAARNVSEHGLDDRITLLRGDLFEAVGDALYDVILANPPYVDAEAMRRLPPEYEFEPKVALHGGPDGLEVVRRILDEAGAHLSPQGGLLCEIGRGRDKLEQSYPETPFLWLDTAESSGEVFWLTSAALDSA